MSAPSLTIWCNPLLNERARELLIAGTRAHRLLFSPEPSYNLVAGPHDPALAEADVAFGQPDPESAAAAPRLRWIQLTSAGYARYDHTEFRAALAARGAVLTNSSQVYAEPCAEHLLAFMLAQARQLPAAFASQLRARSWPTDPLRKSSRLLAGQSVLLLGFGAIARRLVELLKPLTRDICAFRRTPAGNEHVRIVAADELGAALGGADHVINTLPEGPSTSGFMNAARFGAMRPGAVFYNVGRGATVDQAALLGALQSGRLAAAYLDVTDPEPLPPEHPLWTAPNCVITPHTAGGHADEHERFVRHFLENLARFVRGDALLDQVW